MRFKQSKVITIKNGGREVIAYNNFFFASSFSEDGVRRMKMISNNNCTHVNNF